MDDKGISYEMLQDLLRAERRSNRLSPVQPRFWARVRQFLEEVMDAFRQEQEKDPFSRRAMMLRDEAQHAQQAAEGLWALRERKMALYALAQVKKPGEKPEGITRVEEELYDAIMATLQAGRARVLHGGAPIAKPDVPAPAAKPEPSADAPAPSPPAAAEPEPRPAEPDEPDDEERIAAAQGNPVEVPADTPDADMVTIRAISDIPPFVGPDMQTYLLKEGDVAMVPQAIADLLARRGKAEPLDA
ncbi:MAG: hypothetical protein ACPHID_06260 [Thermoplasmatota archaeon]